MGVVLAIGASGCRAASIPRPAGPTAGDLQPLEPGYSWVYVAPGARQIRRVVGSEHVGRLLCTVMEWETGEAVERVWLRAESDGLKMYRISVGDRRFDLDDPVVVIRYPSRVGDRWDYEERHGAVTLSVSALNQGEETVDVPAGRFSAARIHTIKTVGGETVLDQTSWYARGVGLVRMAVTYFEAGRQATSTLELESLTRP